MTEKTEQRNLDEFCKKEEDHNKPLEKKNTDLGIRISPVYHKYPYSRDLPNPGIEPRSSAL